MQALRPDGRSDLPARLANLQRCHSAVWAWLGNKVKPPWRRRMRLSRWHRYFDP